MSHRLRIAYVTTYDPFDVHTWSGSGFFIRRALENAGCEVLPIGNLGVPLRCKPLMKAKSLLYSKFKRQQYHFDRERSVLRAYAAQVADALRRIECDIV